ncbi:hypothetical protein Ga0074812_10527 [Parafrankia irregularis]|uniref:DUF4145 domain-containing protein n=1 Tax=Parafrankia irregularis TaxID=795642 RepID=A0A0S4QJX7_9ACTN|nr:MULTISPECIES: hypothetical protein [Parafrankia]MBE3205722.1 hypothetical protein [Parafrankia sp. CH37]CUU55378.1 hypothetical protein Ga0074812_10527 [Parafrankia irregularis]
MWSYDGFLGKSRLYFSRAQDHSDFEESPELLAHWLILGLEFLLRAPLAKVHPVLLAEPSGSSIMAAAGYPMDAGKPKSIPIKTVIGRLCAIIPEFKDVEKDAEFLSGMRNEQMHSSESPFDVNEELWIPQFTRVVEVLCRYLETDPIEMVGESIVTTGRMLVAAQDKKLENEVRRRVADAVRRFEGLSSEEASRRAEGVVPPPIRRFWDPGVRRTIFSPVSVDGDRVFRTIECPGCRNIIPAPMREVRISNERISGEEIYWDITYDVDRLICPVCELELSSTAEVRCAGIEYRYVVFKSESIDERYMNNFEPDYGND